MSSQFETAPPVPPRNNQSNQQFTNNHPMILPSSQYPFYSTGAFGNASLLPQNSLAYRNALFGNNNSNNGGIQGLHMLAGIENFVTTVNSLAALFESSYMALSNSLRALLSAGDQLASLRIELWNILRAVSLIRGAKWLVRKLLVFLRLAKPTSDSEVAWSEGKRHNRAPSSPLSGASVSRQPNSSYSSGIFLLAFVIGGPWLLYRVLKSSLQSAQDRMWLEERGPHYVARAKFSFVPSNNDEVQFEKGQKVVVATSKDYVGWDVPNEWLLVSTDGSNCGLAPASYLELVQDNSRCSETEENRRTDRSINETKLDFDDKFEIM